MERRFNKAIITGVSLITLTMVDGRPIQINPAAITQMIHAHPSGAKNKEFTDKVKCIIRLADGSFVSVAEDCDTVQRAVEGEK